ncbi:MAG: isoprenylcysteine carboxylmethyltransferase family protein [Gammaproteobacteria bacterium]|nr:isoprenylcysteine carboxylmethyltransferase family protein [Gammaproteobacteria bacterium]MYH85525.1 isoprenylcysteine carboxylmethyltransferase family protein [Gammaproteobacteria bacterium]MYK05416.1 isoprenylcysteine carboxylmethyltransferase family protein [Gammaproteobacteria bacterium]
MEEIHESIDTAKIARRAFWASAAFYALIAFEFFYMASPFAAYFYAVYGPGLDILQSIGLTNWTIQFFLPHALEATSSPLIAILEPLGVAMFFGGLIVFAVGAFQIYRAKLLRKDAVMGGIYRKIRHPQYLALMVASLGLLLVWPRFLVLIFTVIVVFLYIALAKAEERICLARYEGYGAYMRETGMFLPKGWLSGFRVNFGVSTIGRLAGWSLVFIATLAVAIAAAFGLRSHAISSLYAHEAPEGVYLAVTEIDEAEMASIVEIAKTSPDVQAALSNLGGSARILGYVMPREMYVSEIPMYLPPGETFGHSAPRNHDGASWKVIFTQAIVGDGEAPVGRDIVRRAFNKTPLFEVRVDKASQRVVGFRPPPATPYYANHQVPLF